MRSPCMRRIARFPVRAIPLIWRVESSVISVANLMIEWMVRCCDLAPVMPAKSSTGVRQCVALKHVRD